MRSLGRWKNQVFASKSRRSIFIARSSASYTLSLSLHILISHNLPFSKIDLTFHLISFSFFATRSLDDPCFLSLRKKIGNKSEKIEKKKQKKDKKTRSRARRRAAPHTFSRYFPTARLFLSRKMDSFEITKKKKHNDETKYRNFCWNFTSSQFFLQIGQKI